MEKFRYVIKITNQFREASSKDSSDESSKILSNVFTTLTDRVKGKYEESRSKHSWNEANKK